MTISDNVIDLEAHAKVNLTLEILGKRPDGYHELRSVVMPISLADTVSLTPLPSEVILSLSSESWINRDRLGDDEDNLAVRVAHLMQARYKINRGVKIHIHKRIPIGGGMGGGSADAAAVINGLNKIWDLNLSLDELTSFGANLGSDIPSLVHGGVMIMEGRGERVKPLLDNGLDHDCASMWMVVANPGVMCSTAVIYKNWRADLTKPPKIINNIRPHIQKGDVRSVSDALYNGFEDGVFKCYPVVARVSHLLREAGCLGVLLSGSGASVFGLVENKAHGERVIQQLPADLWHMLVQTCPVV
ncbi:MAG: 4-(cytidine 5'-diphospho)-2-C-methyl-D-erythritol kinase [Kiritimatiellae bacterium]|jgi:4-diphosphocytidyl-2-C-methyl-D-erythritol kinase|nr:4-(cytidine 5'-diphospho)-2-C-methyl-D-erythritol kinase [Kiritimatiellia bacterium]